MARIVWIILALVVLNLALFLWPEADRPVNPADQEINASQLQLVSETQAPEPEVVLGPDLEIDTEDGGDSGVETPDTEEDVLDQTQDEPVSSLSCYKIGPFVDVNVFMVARARLDEMGVAFRLGQVEARTTTVVRLYLGPFESQALARAAQAELREKGLMDHFIKADGDADNSEWLLSIGIFVDRIRAERRLALLQRRYPNIQLRVEYTDIPPGLWLIIESDSLTRENETQLLGIPWYESGVELGVSPCDEPLMGENTG